jgi:hypothetical protein
VRLPQPALCLSRERTLGLGLSTLGLGREREGLRLGFGRIVVSGKKAPNMLVVLV